MADSKQANLPSGLLAQQASRTEALQYLSKLRREARDEIDRLLAFLDNSDLDPDLEDGGDLEEGASGSWGKVGGRRAG